MTQVTQAETGGEPPVYSALLVDDILEIRFLVRMLLANVMRCQVIGEAANGAQAVEIARELQPDIVVLDVEMPVMTGREALPKLLMASPASRVIVYSSEHEQSVIDEVMGAGAFCFLHKGKDPMQIVDAVRSALQRCE